MAVFLTPHNNGISLVSLFFVYRFVIKVDD